MYLCVWVCAMVFVCVKNRPSHGKSLGEARTHLKQDFYIEISLSFGRFHFLLELNTIKFEKSKMV